MEKVKQALSDKGVDFEFIYHKSPILSLKDGIEILKINKGQAASTLVLKVEDEYIAVISSGNSPKLDLNRISDVLGYTQVRLAKSDEIKSVTGYEIGTIPLVGMDLPYLVDYRLQSYPFIYGGSGHPNYTLKINPLHLNKVNEIIGLIE
jgi:Cys-tRNA(Pro)/Cys-tRNA(Cys) deacylase